MVVLSPALVDNQVQYVDGQLTIIHWVDTLQQKQLLVGELI